jgi:hypothetical protein
MPRDKPEHLITGTTASDFSDDYAIAVDVSGDACQKARMVSIQQLAQLFNFFLRRSRVKQRLDKNDADTATL